MRTLRKGWPTSYSFSLPLCRTFLFVLFQIQITAAAPFRAPPIPLAAACSSALALPHPNATLNALASLLAAPPPHAELHATCPEAATLRGIALLREGSLAAGSSLLEALIAAAPPHFAWPARAYLGATLELAARELSLRGKPDSAALRAAAAQFEASLLGRAAWLALGAPRPSLGAAAQPLPMVYRSLGQCLLWAGDEAGARGAFQRGVDEGFGWVDAWARPSLPLPLHGGSPRRFYTAADSPPLAPTLRALERELPAMRAAFYALQRGGGLLPRRRGCSRRGALAAAAAAAAAGEAGGGRTCCLPMARPPPLAPWRHAPAKRCSPSPLPQRLQTGKQSSACCGGGRG